jgi:hypothetical protein
MDTPIELPNENQSWNHLTNLVAISIALLAAFMAVTKVKDDNLVQAMLQAKSDAVDTWSQYQAKRLRQALLDSSLDQATALRASAQPATAAVLDEQIRRDKSEIERYKIEEAELQAKAKAKEAEYDTLNYRDDQFDLSDASLSVAVAMLAVVALTNKRWLLWMSWVFAAFGVAMGLAGLLGWHLHPDWLTKLLT